MLLVCSTWTRIIQEDIIGFGYLNETQYVHDITDVRRVSDGGYLQ